MGLRQTIGQQMMIGLKGTTLGAEEKSFITENNIGGVTLFGRNLDSPEQIHALVSELQSLKSQTESKTPFVVAIDMEGGRVSRLKAPFTMWPALEKLAALDSTSVAFKFSNLMATELKAMGINLDYAPCIDVLTNKDNEVIGDRSLGNEPGIVEKLGSALVRGYIKSGIIPCAKHFPGHGGVALDSHEELPEDKSDLETLKSIHMAPFKKVFRARLPMVMTAHIRYQALDPEWPATLSKSIIDEYIRGEFKFRNIIISDDLDMKALRNHWSPEEIAKRAVTAGCNLLLYCNDFETPELGLAAVEKAVTDGEIEKSVVEANAQMMLSMKEAHLKDYSIPDFKDVTQFIGHPDHKRLAQAILDGDVPEDLTTT